MNLPFGQEKLSLGFTRGKEWGLTQKQFNAEHSAQGQKRKWNTNNKFAFNTSPGKNFDPMSLVTYPVCMLTSPSEVIFKRCQNSESVQDMKHVHFNGWKLFLENNSRAAEDSCPKPPCSEVMILCAGQQ